MNNQSRGYAIIAFLIWPFSAFFIGIKSLDSVFGKRLFIALYAFLGFTAVSVGDLERYEAEFYEKKSTSFVQILTDILSLQDGKILYSVLSFFSGLIFDSHHYYFLLLFLLYGYFYISTIYIVKEISYKKLGNFGIIFFFGVLMFLLIRPIINTAYYTGAAFLFYMLVSYFRTSDKKYLWLMIFAPFFHLGLAIYLLVPLLLLLFKNKIWYYVIFVVVTFFVGKSSVVGIIEGAASANSNTVLESKFDSYASEEGQEYLENRYSENAAKSNIKLQSLVFLTDTIIYYFVPIGIAIIFFRRKYLLVDASLRKLFHIVLIFWGIANLMLNISQGVRFVVLFAFLSIVLIYSVYLETRKTSNIDLFNKFVYLFVPVLFLSGLMLAYASNVLFVSQFFISNFVIEIFNYY